MENTSLFTCPVCGAPLARGAKTYCCPKKHSFDIAGKGYINLLPSNQKNSSDPGDDQEMVAARSRLLSHGYYAPLREALATLAVQSAPQNAHVADLGCGEGYYTAGVLGALTAAGRAPRVVGIDISKSAAKLAAKSCCPAAEIAVGSVFRLPMADSSADLLINCFSPLCIPEITRVLRPGGRFLYVVPGAKHLWGLKTAVYANPYQNEEKETPYPGLSHLGMSQVEGTIVLQNNADIFDIFRMTPYFWKTGREDQQKLAGLQTLETPIAFGIHIYAPIPHTSDSPKCANT